MKLKNMFLFSSALMAIAPMSIALAEEANTNDKIDSTNKTETTSDNKTESKIPKEFEGLKIAKDKGPNIAYVSNENLSKEETDKIRDIKKDETIKACSVYKMVYKKTEEPPTPPVTPPETPPTPPETPPTPPEEPPKEDPVIRGSVVVHHIWTDGTRAYPSEWVMKDQPIGTEYTTDWHHEDIGVWTKDGQRFKSIKDIFPDEDAYDPGDGYYYAEKAVKDKNLNFYEDGNSNFIQFHNLPEAYRNSFTCVKGIDGYSAFLTTDDILDLMTGVKITSQNITESKLPDVMKNKLKNVVTTGGVTSEGKLYYSGLDPINEFKYVKVADYSDPVTGTVKEKLQEITYVYDRNSYKVKGPITVCATDHI